MAVGDADVWGAAAIIVWVVLISFAIALCGVQVYVMGELEELERDRINVYDFCPWATRMALLDMGLHAGMTVTLIALGHWVLFLAQMPLLAWNAMEYSAGSHEWDATRALERRYKTEKRNAMYARTVFYGCVTVMFLYRLVSSIIGVIMGTARQKARNTPFTGWGRRRK